MGHVACVWVHPEDMKFPDSTCCQLTKVAVHDYTKFRELRASDKFVGVYAATIGTREADTALYSPGYRTREHPEFSTPMTFTERVDLIWKTFPTANPPAIREAYVLMNEENCVLETVEENNDEKTGLESNQTHQLVWFTLGTGRNLITYVVSVNEINNFSRPYMGSNYGGKYNTTYYPDWDDRVAESKYPKNLAINCLLSVERNFIAEGVDLEKESFNRELNTTRRRIRDYFTKDVVNKDTRVTIKPTLTTTITTEKVARVESVQTVTSEKGESGSVSTETTDTHEWGIKAGVESRVAVKAEVPLTASVETEVKTSFEATSNWASSSSFRNENSRSLSKSKGRSNSTETSKTITKTTSTSVEVNAPPCTAVRVYGIRYESDLFTSTVGAHVHIVDTTGHYSKDQMVKLLERAHPEYVIERKGRNKDVYVYIANMNVKAEVLEDSDLISEPLPDQLLVGCKPATC